PTGQHRAPQTMRLLTMIAPVAAAGYPSAPNETNLRSPGRSVAVKRGAKPTSFAATTVMGPGAGPLPAAGPRAISSDDSVRARTRLVNQLESGTSSMVFTLAACTPVASSPGLPNRLAVRSTNKSIVHSWTFDASCVSGSRVSGSSRRNRGPVAAGDPETSATASVLVRSQSARGPGVVLDRALGMEPW